MVWLAIWHSFLLIFWEVHYMVLWHAYHRLLSMIPGSAEKRVISLHPKIGHSLTRTLPSHVETIAGAPPSVSGVSWAVICGHFLEFL